MDKSVKNPFSVEEVQAARSLDVTERLAGRPAAQGITIDGETSLDLDDAFWVVPQGNGAIAYLYVADPTVAIPKNSVLDRMVRKRVTSRYFPWGVEPMLPTVLSHGSLSLLPGPPKPALELAIALDENAAVHSVGWRFVQFTNLRKLSYGGADKILEQPEDPLFTQLSYAQIWAKKLSARRRKQGAIGAMVVGGVYYDEEGRASTQPLRSQMLIAELAILANITLANLLRESGYPALFRNHGARQWEGTTAELIQTLTTGNPGEAIALRNRLSHNLDKAQYGSAAEGHFALAELAYCHGTSPLRRLADFVNHRVLQAIAQKQPPPYTNQELTVLADHINTTLEGDKEEVDDVHRQQRHALYRRQLEQEKTVRSLDDDEFIKLLNFSLKPENFKAYFVTIREEILQRVQQLGVAEWAALLTTPGMVEQEPAIAQKIYDCLRKSPELAISTLDVLKSQKGWSVDFEIDGQPNHWVARAIVTITENNTEMALTAPQGVGRIKKQARAKGAIAWWNAHIQQTLIPLTQAPNLDPTPPTPKSTSPQQQKRQQKQWQTNLNPIAENFVGQLNTHCQRQGLPMAKERYSQTETGEFVCELTLEGAIAQGQGRTKKLAKQWAAYDLLKSLKVIS